MRRHAEFTEKRDRVGSRGLGGIKQAEAIGATGGSDGASWVSSDGKVRSNMAGTPVVGVGTPPDGGLSPSPGRHALSRLPLNSGAPEPATGFGTGLVNAACPVQEDRVGAPGARIRAVSLAMFLHGADRPASQPFAAVGRRDCHSERRAGGDAADPHPALHQDVMFAMMGTSLSTSTSSWDNRANTRQAATSAQLWYVP